MPNPVRVQFQGPEANFARGSNRGNLVLVSHLRKELCDPKMRTLRLGQNKADRLALLNAPPNVEERILRRMGFNPSRLAYFVLPVALAMSTETPGPIVEDTAIFFIYVPFAPVGRAFATASTKAIRFSSSCVAVKDALPIPA